MNQLVPEGLLPEVARLAEYRLDHDLTFEQLAAEMQAHGLNIKMRALQNALTGRTEAPLHRTMRKIQKFLEVMEQQERQKAERQKARKGSARKRRGASARAMVSA